MTASQATPVHARAALAATLAALAVAAAGCGGGEDAPAEVDGRARGQTLTVYSSLPLQGPFAARGEAIARGARLALAERGGRAGRFRARHVSLDSAGEPARSWTPEQVLENARRAADDPATIAYIGDLHSGATAISLPVLNEEGIPQLSPGSTAIGLVREALGTGTGEPHKYYPRERRTFVRLVPDDAAQGKALARAMRAAGCRRPAVADPRETYRSGLAKLIERAARREGLRVVLERAADPDASDYSGLAAAAAERGADCFVYTGLASRSTAFLYEQVAAALPRARLFGSADVGAPELAGRGEAGLGPEVARRTAVTLPVAPPGEYPPRGRRALRQLESERGEARSGPIDPYALYGYEAMRLVLDAIARLGPRGNDRRLVVRELLGAQVRGGALGDYRIDRRGDTSLGAYGLWRIRDGELVYAGRP